MYFLIHFINLKTQFKKYMRKDGNLNHERECENPKQNISITNLATNTK